MAIRMNSVTHIAPSKRNGLLHKMGFAAYRIAYDSGKFPKNFTCDLFTKMCEEFGKNDMKRHSEIMERLCSLIPEDDELQNILADYQYLMCMTDESFDRAMRLQESPEDIYTILEEECDGTDGI